MCLRYLTSSAYNQQFKGRLCQTQLTVWTAYVTVNGISIMVVGILPIAHHKTRNAIRMDSVHGYKEKPTPGFISMRVRDSGGTTVADFNDQTDVNIVAELANGKLSSVKVYGQSTRKKLKVKMQNLKCAGKAAR